VLSQGARPTPAAPSQRAAARVTRAAPASEPAPAKNEAAPAKHGASEYKVKPGDTLGKIAGQVKPTDVSLDMMLVALYRANPDAFAGNNMNRLKSGQILAVPDAETVKGTSDSEARGVVVAHAADFNAYRNKLAGQVATAAPDKERASTQSAAGKITAKVQERPTAANESKDQLKLSKAVVADAAGAKGATLSAEDKIAKDRALADATARVKELERNVSDLEKLMAVKNKAAAEAIKEPLAKPVAPPAAASAPASVKPAPVVASASAPAKPASKHAKKAASPMASEPGIVDLILDNITPILIGLGAILAAVLGIGALRRRKQVAKAPTEPSILGAPTDQAHSLFAETGGQSIDTNNSVFNSSFAPSASQLDTNEVDPVAEADVYIAYGRDAQAEEILKEALRTHPERMPVRLKLLEIYAARKDLRAFETQASEMFGLTHGHGDDWAQAAVLGLSIDPDNPLYASAATAAPVTPAPTAEELAQQVMLSQQLDQSLAANADAHHLDMDLAADATMVPAAPAPAPAAAAEDDHVLDFDLGGLSFEPVTSNAPNAAPQAEPVVMPASAHVAEPAMDFSMPAAAPAPAPAPTAAADEAFDMAFDMDFDAPAAGATEAGADHAKALDGLSLDLPHAAAEPQFGAAGLSDQFDMTALPDLPSTPSTPLEQASANHALMDLDAMDFALPDEAPVAPSAAAPLDFGLPDLPAATPAARTAPEFDMSTIDLDLPSSDAAPSALPELGGLGEPDPFGALDHAAAAPGELSAVHMEMETKLDLAIAYQEIGDKEGARELLDEVIKGGSAEQVGKANAMRTKLG